VGLDVSVGVFTLFEEDDEYRSELVAQFKAINDRLALNNLPLHMEPQTPATNFTCQMWGYSGLHTLRRIAAHLQKADSVPPPLGKDDSEDPVMKAYYDNFESLTLGPKPTFEHLIGHSDAEGFYVPVDFEHVLFDEDGSKLWGDMLGSTYRLREECKLIATRLEMPIGIDVESDELWEAAEAKSSPGPLWKQYGIETFCCLRLLKACEISLQEKAVILFH
jgi:hypothetical protein